MKKIFSLNNAVLVVSFVFATPALAVSIAGLDCQSEDPSARIHISFRQPIDPLKPIIGNESLAAAVSVSRNNSPQTYHRDDLRLYPDSYNTADVNLRGGAAGMVHLRLSPKLKDGLYAGAYAGDLFINDLDVKAYFNFVGTSSAPGLLCH